MHFLTVVFVAWTATGVAASSAICQAFSTPSQRTVSITPFMAGFESYGNDLRGSWKVPESTSNWQTFASYPNAKFKLEVKMNGGANNMIYAVCLTINGVKGPAIWASSLPVGRCLNSAGKNSDYEYNICPLRVGNQVYVHIYMKYFKYENLGVSPNDLCHPAVFACSGSSSQIRPFENSPPITKPANLITAVLYQSDYFGRGMVIQATSGAQNNPSMITQIDIVNQGKLVYSVNHQTVGQQSYFNGFVDFGVMYFWPERNGALDFLLLTYQSSSNSLGYVDSGELCYGI